MDPLILYDASINSWQKNGINRLARPFGLRKDHYIRAGIFLRELITACTVFNYPAEIMQIREEPSGQQQIGELCMATHVFMHSRDMLSVMKRYNCTAGQVYMMVDVFLEIIEEHILDHKQWNSPVAGSVSGPPIFDNPGILYGAYFYLSRRAAKSAISRPLNTSWMTLDKAANYALSCVTTAVLRVFGATGNARYQSELKAEGLTGLSDLHRFEDELPYEMNQARYNKEMERIGYRATSLPWDEEKYYKKKVFFSPVSGISGIDVVFLLSHVVERRGKTFICFRKNTEFVTIKGTLLKIPLYINPLRNGDQVLSLAENIKNISNWSQYYHIRRFFGPLHYISSKGEIVNPRNKSFAEQIFLAPEMLPNILRCCLNNHITVEEFHAESVLLALKNYGVRGCRPVSEKITEKEMKEYIQLTVGMKNKKDSRLFCVLDATEKPLRARSLTSAIQDITGEELENVETVLSKRCVTRDDQGTFQLNHKHPSGVQIRRLRRKIRSIISKRDLVESGFSPLQNGTSDNFTYGYNGSNKQWYNKVNPIREATYDKAVLAAYNEGKDIINEDKAMIHIKSVDDPVIDQYQIPQNFKGIPAKNFPGILQLTLDSSGKASPPMLFTTQFGINAMLFPLLEEEEEYEREAAIVPEKKKAQDVNIGQLGPSIDGTF